MMRKYESYKDSGIEWVGEIPEHWEVKKLKYVVTFNDEVLGDKTDGSYEIEYVEISDVHASKGIVNSETVLFKDAPSRARRLVKHGDVIVSTVRTYLRAISKVENPPANLVVSTGFAVIRPIKIDYKFAGYLFISEYIINEIIGRSVGVSYPAINASELVNIKSILPPVKEQKVIGNFLDLKTTQIDTLIQKKQQLIALLEEEKTAVINEAVTNGIIPGVPMKDSGVEWLGMVPEHWKISKLKRLCSLLKDGTHLPPPRVPEGKPLLSVRNLVNGNFIRFLDDDSKISEEDFITLTKSFQVQENDLLLAVVGATMGKVSLVPPMAPFTIQRSLAIFRPETDVLAFKFLFFLFQSSSFQSLLWNQTGFSAQPGIYLGSLSNFSIAYPSIEEQKEIVSHLEDITTKINNTIAHIEKEIELMQEYRTALISEAVTGKIDVRDYQLEQKLSPALV